MHDHTKSRVDQIKRNVRQLAPKTISPGRLVSSLWTISPQSLDNYPPVFGQLPPTHNFLQTKAYLSGIIRLTMLFLLHLLVIDFYRIWWVLT